jgi:hypothetical protein
MTSASSRKDSGSVPISSPLWIARAVIWWAVACATAGLVVEVVYAVTQRG